MPTINRSTILCDFLPFVALVVFLCSCLRLHVKEYIVLRILLLMCSTDPTICCTGCGYMWPGGSNAWKSLLTIHGQGQWHSIPVMMSNADRRNNSDSAHVFVGIYHSW